MAIPLRTNRLRWGPPPVATPPPVVSDGVFPWPGFTPLRTVYVSTALGLELALANALPGDDIVVANGLYLAPGNQNDGWWHGEWSFNMNGNRRDGTAAHPIRLRSENLWGARLGREGTLGAILGTGGASWIIIDGITVDEADTAVLANDTGCIVLGNRDFRSGNCLVANVQVLGRTVTAADFGGIADNHPGVRVEGTDNCSVVNSYISGFNGYEVSPSANWHQNHAGIMTYHTTGLVVDRNTVEYCGSGVYIKGDNRGTIVKLNRTFGCERGFKTSYANNDEPASTIYAAAASTPILVFKNLFINGTAINGRSPVNSVGMDVAEVTYHVHTFNNTVHGCNYGLNGNNFSSSNCNHYNNIFAECANHGGGYQLNLSNASPVGVFDVIDRNVYASGQDRFWWHDTSSTLTLAAWRTNSGFDPNSVTTDPQLDANYMAQAGYVATLGRDLLDMFGGGVNSVVPAGAFTTGTEAIGRQA